MGRCSRRLNAQNATATSARQNTKPTSANGSENPETGPRSVSAFSHKGRKSDRKYRSRTYGCVAQYMGFGIIDGRYVFAVIFIFRTANTPETARAGSERNSAGHQRFQSASSSKRKM